jgi:aminoglycoside phosphotransferase (APT) family kinase protein
VIDFQRLAQWMDDNGLPGAGEPIEEHSGGTQNEIYEIRRGAVRCVIRIPRSVPVYYDGLRPVI